MTRLLPLLSLGLSLLSATALATNKEKWASLASTSKDGVLILNSASYDELIAEPREYSISVVLTALPANLNCAPCHAFDPTFHTVSKNWKRLSKEQSQDHFFAQLDFTDGQEIYKRLGLASAPTMQYFPATKGPHASKSPMITYDFNRHGFSVENLHNFISNLVPHKFEIHIPFNPLPYIILPLVFLSIITSLYFSYPYIWPLLQNKQIWTLGSIVLILTFTSGEMWNRIRNAPWAQGGNLVAGGFSSQFVAETRIVALLYGVLALSTILLTTYVPHMKGVHRQRGAIYTWMAVLIVFFSVLVKLFKVKNGGYPFSLLLG